jgi:UrcA family protein
MTMNTTTQNSNRSRATAAVLFGALALSFAGICTAEDTTGAAQETVKYSDLNVSRTAGADALYTRISMAAGDVCRILDHGDLSSKLNFDRCVHKAIANAVAKLDQPALNSVYNAKNPAAKPVMLAAGQSR